MPITFRRPLFSPVLCMPRESSPSLRPETPDDKQEPMAHTEVSLISASKSLLSTPSCTAPSQPSTHASSRRTTRAHHSRTNTTDDSTLSTTTTMNSVAAYREDPVVVRRMREKWQQLQRARCNDGDAVTTTSSSSLWNPHGSHGGQRPQEERTCNCDTYTYFFSAKLTNPAQLAVEGDDDSRTSLRTNTAANRRPNASTGHARGLNAAAAAAVAVAEVEEVEDEEAEKEDNMSLFTADRRCCVSCEGEKGLTASPPLTASVLHSPTQPAPPPPRSTTATPLHPSDRLSVDAETSLPQRVTAAEYVPVRAVMPPTGAHSSVAVPYDTHTSQEIDNPSRRRRHLWCWLSFRREPIDDALTSDRAAEEGHANTFTNMSHSQTHSPRAGEQNFQGARSSPATHENDGSRTPPAQLINDTIGVGVDAVRGGASDEDDEDSEDDDEVRMITYNTALSLCCCGMVDCCCDPAATLFFGNTPQLQNDTDESSADSDDDDDGDEEEESDEYTSILTQRQRFLSPQPPTTPTARTLYTPYLSSPTEAAAASWIAQPYPSPRDDAAHTDTRHAHVSGADLLSSPASRRLAWVLPSVPSYSHAATPNIPSYRGGEDEDETRPANAHTLPSRRACHGCLHRAHRSCARKLRRTWRFMNVFTPAHTTDHAAENESASAVRTPSPSQHQQQQQQQQHHQQQAWSSSSAREPTVTATLYPLGRSPRSASASHFFTEPELSSWARWYCLLNYAAAALTLLASAVLLISTYGPSLSRQTISGPYDIRDGTVCHALTFRERLHPDLSFSIASFLVNSYFLVWCALRAVRLESPGLLLCHGLVVVIEISRIAYFLGYVAGRYLVQMPTTPNHVPALNASWSVWLADDAPHNFSQPQLTVWGRLGTALLCVAALLLFTSLVLAVPVHRAFGWRSFLTGWTQPESLKLRQRFTYFQTCLQLDGVVTLNVALALVFLLDSPLHQVLNALLTGLTWLVLVLLTPLLYRAQLGMRYVLVMTASAAVFLLAMSFYVVVIARNLRAYTFDTVTDGADNVHRDPRASPCYRGQLSTCLSRRYMLVVSRHNESAPVFYGPEAFPSSLSSPVFHQSRTDASFVASPLMQRHAVPDLDGRWENGSTTFLPTQSRRGEFLQLLRCDIEDCFPHQGADYVDAFHQCCGGYGVCRLKDAFRTYGVLLVLLLTVTLVMARGALVWLSGCRAAAADDEAILTLQTQRRRRRRRHG